MKKYLFSALAAGLLLTSCQSDEPFAPGEGGEKQVTFTLNVPGDLGTRAAAGANKSDKGGVTNEGADKLKYTLVLTANGDSQILDNDDATVNGTTATFKPTVVLGRNYTITAYASLNGTAWNGTDAIDITNDINNEAKDAYFFTTTHNFADGNLSTLNLQRPFGKLRLIAEDYDPAKTKVEKVTVTYNNPQQATFNPTTKAFTIDDATVAGQEKDFGYYEAADATGAHTIFAEYLPAPESDEYGVKFTVTVKYADSDETYTRSFDDIPVKRNALTTLKGNFFTANSEITVQVDENFDNSKAENITFKTVSTASQLQQAINDAQPGETTTIQLTENIVLDSPLVFGGNSSNPAPTRSAASTVYVLDLGGKTLSGVDKSEKNYSLIDNRGNLSIVNGTLKLQATVNSGWNRYSAVIANNPGGHLTVEEGVVIEHLGGTDMAYGIDNLTNGKGTYAETIINGGHVKSTYRAIRQFLNGVEAQNILTVNGGKIEGANKSIWMQDPSAKANTGTLYVGVDAQLYGDVYLYVTPGSTEWPVEVEIAKAALQGESEVMSANVPAGYLVEEDDDCYKVVCLSDKLAANFAENSWDNIILACQSNMVPETWNVGDQKAMTIDGNEYNIAIIGKNHDTYTAGGTAPLTFQLADVYGTTAAMNATQTNATGWSGSRMRTVTMAEILDVMPVKDAIKAVNKETLNGERNALETTSDKLFLLSEIEVNGSVHFSNNLAEGSKYAYYEDKNNKIMSATWWLRGPGKNNGIGFTQINMSGYMANGSAEYACGVVFGFCF